MSKHRFEHDIDVSGNIILSGNIDGRDVATDGTNLDNHIATTVAHGVVGDVVGTTDTQTLTNKTVYGNTFTIAHHNAPTQKILFNVSGSESTTSTTILALQTADRSVSLPDASTTLVGTDNIQTLTNKTINSPIFNNWIRLDDISVPSNPSNGQGYLYKKTGNDGLFWKPDSGGAELDLTAGGGETNTVSNVGTGGVGVFKQKSGVNFEFKKINSGSGISITDDTGNNEVDIGLNINGLTADATPDGSNDYIVTYDASASNHKKVLLNNLPGSSSLTTYQVTATTTTSTTSSTYVLMSGMTITPASGTYFVSFSSSGNLDSAYANAIYAIYSGGTKVAHSERNIAWNGGGHAGGLENALHTQCTVTVNGSQDVAVYYTPTDNVTFSVNERSLFLLKIG